MTKENIEMTKGNAEMTINLQEELKMKNENIEMVRKAILDEYSYVIESLFYVEERGYEMLRELRAKRELLEKSVNKMYDARIESGVEDEDLGRDIDEIRITLHRKLGNLDREIEKRVAARNEEIIKEMVLREEEEIKAEAREIEVKVEEILQAAGEQADEIEETIRSLNIDRNKKFGDYVERQEEYLTSEMNKKYSFKMIVEILKYALENIEKEMIEGDTDLTDLSVELQLMVAAAKNRLDDARSKRKINIEKIRSTENILREERRKEEEY